MHRRRIVISQPMFFPWAGIFEQIRLADVFVHYDDVQFPQGRSFISRVQIKTPKGQQWLTAPVQRKGQSLIRDVKLDSEQPWRDKHLRTLELNYKKAPFVDDMLNLVQSVYRIDTDWLSELNIAGTEQVCRYFGLDVEFQTSSDMPTETHSSQKLIDLTTRLQGDVYITGHGARNYLDHEAFKSVGIDVEYMDYQKVPFSQQHGPFTPFVSILDLIANEGVQGKRVIQSPSIPWREFIKQHG